MEGNRAITGTSRHTAWLAAKIHRAAVAAQVKARVLKAVFGVDEPGDDVLGGVVLHLAKALGPVQRPLHRFPHGQGPVGVVEDDAAPLVGAGHVHGAQGARVRRLAPLLGEKGRGGKDHVPSAGGLPAVHYLCREALGIGVFVVELSRVHRLTSPGKKCILWPMDIFTVLLIYLEGVNLLTLVVYGLDKHRARVHRERIPEAALLGLAAIGGAVGALAGMFLFRHKIRKRKFTVGVPVILALEILVVLGVIYILSGDPFLL